MLMQIDPYVAEDNNWNILRWLVYVCFGISIVCLVITLMVLIYIRCVSTSDKKHMQTYIAVKCKRIALSSGAISAQHSLQHRRSSL